MDTLSYILHHIVGKVRHKTNTCGIFTFLHNVFRFFFFRVLINSLSYKPLSLQYKFFGNIMGKEDIAHNEQFYPFPTLFSSLLGNFLPSTLKLSSAKSMGLEEYKIFHLGKG